MKKHVDFILAQFQEDFLLHHDKDGLHTQSGYLGPVIHFSQSTYRVLAIFICLNVKCSESHVTSLIGFKAIASIYKDLHFLHICILYLLITNTALTQKFLYIVLTGVIPFCEHINLLCSLAANVLWEYILHMCTA